MTVGNEPAQSHDSTTAFYEKYETKEVLGKGLSSIVKRCIEKKSGRSYACKIIDFPDGSSETREATQNEIAILKIAGQHPNIIEIHETFEENNCAFIVMEFCGGGELFDYLTKVVRLSEKKARVQMKCIFDAVRHLHRHNIVHRDLKPENILLDEKYNVKITDLGLSVIIQDDQYLREVCGTVGYMAPEILLQSLYPDQIKGYGKPVDLWACGVILYTMLSGMPPFWHRKQNILLRMIMEAKYSFENVIWDEVSTSAKDLISGLLQFDPAKRLTAEQALNHSWFAPQVARREGFEAKRALKAHIIVVWTIFRLKTLRYSNKSIKGKELLENPYRYKVYRKIVDSGAFEVYAHWVQKAANQNRAALFESKIRGVEVRS